jgi:hypothetical protein
MAQMGHTTPNLTLTIYARQMDRRDGEPDRLKLLVDGHSPAAALDRNLGAFERAGNATGSCRRLSDEGPSSSDRNRQ